MEEKMRIALTSVIVNDPIEAHKVYTEVLGFASKLYMPDANLAIVVSPDDPDGTALLLEPNDNPISKTFQQAVYKLGLPVIVFGTDDIGGEVERLKKRGVRFTQEPTRTPAGTQAVFDDTCGNLIQIHQA
jgi:predicted enzyme related to lactoylglutathione lyase